MNNEDNHESGFGGLFGAFMDVLDSVNESEKQKAEELENEKKRYRDAIVDQNLYEGKTYEDLYDELNGE